MKASHLPDKAFFRVFLNFDFLKNTVLAVFFFRGKTGTILHILASNFRSEVAFQFCFITKTNNFIVALHKFMHIIDVGALTDLK